ncbi:MAG TPA: I78 family peptidase inhibitor [Pseudomonas sp.]|nr:I78 family peptidase inhibitor [Pseudomonas sp.]
MRRPFQLTALLACTLLAACSNSPDKPADADQPADGRCNADAVQNLLDQRLNSDLADQAKDKAGARYLRVTYPNQPVTLDYNAQRLNIEIDDGDIILRLSCG